MDGNQCKTKENTHNNKRKLKITYNISIHVFRAVGTVLKMCALQVWLERMIIQFV